MTGKRVHGSQPGYICLNLHVYPRATWLISFAFLHDEANGADRRVNFLLNISAYLDSLVWSPSYLINNLNTLLCTTFVQGDYLEIRLVYLVNVQAVTEMYHILFSRTSNEI